ncbi:MAG: hypothetical protein B9S35_15205 [Opitutia bacterium Tous-C5TDCM]|nr:MAG: hypothetical protein B9S35_15205 [Opitutae bacterium Tous-C5TDCM]
MITDLTTSTRRQWVKQFMFGTAAALTGSSWTSRVLAEVTSTGPGPGVLRIKPASYPALAAPGGSIQLKFIGYLKPLTLNRVTAERFVTLDSICTHSQCTVGRFIVAQNRMRCPCHGSRYDIEGKVFRDGNGISTEPAEDDLGTYLTHFDVPTGIVSITIPDLALHINSISVHQQGPGESVRLKLVFPVSYGAIYEIRYQATLADPLTLASFSRTPTGLANQTQVGPEAEGNFTAYVDAVGSKGFFVVGVRLTEV